ncbi:hypothetical protein Xszus_00581 [Xenorhabdus szentirmaii]|nr:hypothetical protein Xsze_03530 [Xenorhabdus szentirmaii DSM 16338]PHM40906.1 hypothetical protein Xszus_00581 [Xenorhabdus szentirmaii]
MKNKRVSDFFFFIRERGEEGILNILKLKVECKHKA